MVYAPSGGWQARSDVDASDARHGLHSHNGFDDRGQGGNSYEAEDSWRDWADVDAVVECGGWGIHDPDVVEIVKKETLNVLGIPRICSGDQVHIHCLNLQENNFGDEGVEALVGYLTRNRIRVDILRLFKNPNVGNKSASKLRELYSQDARAPPKELHVSNCSVGSTGAADLLLAIARRWRTAERFQGKAAKAAYVRLDNNRFDLESVVGKLQEANFYIRQGYDPRCRHSDICEVHEVGGGPSLIMIPQMSLRSLPSRGGQWRQTPAAAEEPPREAPREQPAPTFKGPPEIVEENPADPPKDCEGAPIRKGCKVQYHDDSNWVGLVVGFDFKGTAVIDWQSGAKKGERTGAGGRYVRVVADRPEEVPVQKDRVMSHD
ncbi:unnamed protein product [Symbiodinium sp. CCMP2592]|nr:unnamed protein product [Symbiodinium sp. CCMP2592]